MQYCLSEKRPSLGHRVGDVVNRVVLPMSITLTCVCKVDVFMGFSILPVELPGVGVFSIIQTLTTVATDGYIRATPPPHSFSRVDCFSIVFCINIIYFFTRSRLNQFYLRSEPDFSFSFLLLKQHETPNVVHKL